MFLGRGTRPHVRRKDKFRGPAPSLPPSAPSGVRGGPSPDASQVPVGRTTGVLCPRPGRRLLGTPPGEEKVALQAERLDSDGPASVTAALHDNSFDVYWGNNENFI